MHSDVSVAEVSEEIPGGAFVPGFLQVLSETFEGARPDASLYLDHERNTGLFATLNALSAEQASRATPLGPAVASLAEHVLFHLSATTAALRGEALALDWAASWDVQVVTDASWRELRGQLHDEYHELRRLVLHREAWDADEVAGVVAAVTHVAYHLGVMRQVAKLV